MILIDNSVHISTDEDLDKFMKAFNDKYSDIREGFFRDLCYIHDEIRDLVVKKVNPSYDLLVVVETYSTIFGDFTDVNVYFFPFVPFGKLLLSENRAFNSYVKNKTDNFITLLDRIKYYENYGDGNI